MSTIPEAVTDALARIGGRKFEVADVTPELQTAAEAWLGSYTGDFSYLVDVARHLARKGTISTPQAKGVLNCIRAEASRTSTPSTKKSPADLVGPGLYLLPHPGGSIEHGTVYKVKASKATGRCYALRLDGGHWSYDRGGIFKLDSSLAVTVEQARAFGATTGFCIACGKQLDNDESVDRGFGPVCGQRYGWIDKAYSRKASQKATPVPTRAEVVAALAITPDPEPTPAPAPAPASGPAKGRRRAGR